MACGYCLLPNDMGHLSGCPLEPDYIDEDQFESEEDYFDDLREGVKYEEKIN